MGNTPFLFHIHLFQRICSNSYSMTGADPKAGDQAANDTDLPVLKERSR